MEENRPTMLAEDVLKKEKISTAMMQEANVDVPRYQQTEAESYQVPKVMASKEDLAAALARRRDNIVKLQQEQAERDFVEKNGFMPSGKQRRALRRKLERMYDSKKTKTRNLN